MVNKIYNYTNHIKKKKKKGKKKGREKKGRKKKREDKRRKHAAIGRLQPYYYRPARQPLLRRLQFVSVGRTTADRVVCS